jgi:RNA polymerase sigma-70 factor (ECF subfamily)
LAEDLAQDTLMEAWKCLRRFNERCQFFTWLCAILSNRYCNTVRRKRPFAFSTLSRLDSEGFQTTVNNLADEHSSPDQAVLVREQAAVVRGCIEALPPKQRQVIVMRFFGDDSLEGIAAALDCSVGTVKSRLFHALEKLRAMNALSGRSQL